MFAQVSHAMDEIFINMISPYFCTKLVLHRLCTYLVPSEICTVLALPDFCTDEILKRIFTEDEINNADIIFIDVVDWISIDLSIDLMVFFSLNKKIFCPWWDNMLILTMASRIVFYWEIKRTHFWYQLMEQKLNN